MYEAAVPENVRKAFDMFDTDRSGDIDRYELKKALRQLGMDADSVQTHGVLQKYDTTGRGTLNVQQFNKLVAELQAFQRTQPAAAAKPASPSAQAAAARRCCPPPSAPPWPPRRRCRRAGAGCPAQESAHVP